MRRHLLRLLINTLGLFAAVQFVAGVRFDGPWWKLVLVALVFGVVNAYLRPLLTVLTCPLVLLTLGVFTIVINAALLWLTGKLASMLVLGFEVRGFGGAILGALVISAVSVVMSMITHEPRVQKVKIVREKRAQE